MLSDGAQARPEGVGDEVYLEVGWGAHDDHHVILDSHGQAVVSDVAVGGIDKVIDFFLRDGLHRVKMGIGFGAGLDLDDVEPVGGGFLGDNIDFQMP